MAHVDEDLVERGASETRPPAPLGPPALGTLVDQRTADELGRAASLPDLARGGPAALVVEPSATAS